LDAAQRKKVLKILSRCRLNESTMADLRADDEELGRIYEVIGLGRAVEPKPELIVLAIWSQY
jgi:hypothetical protein